MRRPLSLLLSTALAATVIVTGSSAASADPVPGTDLTLTLLHSNDGESRLIPDDRIGGVARFATIVADAQAAADTGPDGGAITISSGDNFLAGPQFAASQEKGVPFYDTTALDLMDYDVSAIGNHEFDFGPDTLADFIGGFTDGDDVDITFVSANLDVSGVPSLAALADDGTIVASTTFDVDGRAVGVVGATTPALRSISSPGAVTVDPDVVAAVQTEIDAFTADGVGIVVLTSHLQDVDADVELVGQLTDLDAAIAGGGDELLANEGEDALLAGDAFVDDPATEEDETTVSGPYPLVAQDADGGDVPIVTTSGNYGYLGRLTLDFDAAGELLAVDDELSGPIANPAPDSESDAPVAEPDPTVQTEVVDPVQTYVDGLQDNVIAESEVDLDGLRASVRTVETNEGNLLADALLDAGQDRAEQFGVDSPQIAIQNGGGIRNDSIIEAGPATEFDTFSIAPFTNFVSVTEDVPSDVVKALFERAYSAAPEQGGQFAQIAGMTVLYDPDNQAQEVEGDGTDVTITTPGERIVSITLDDGTKVVVNGEPVEGVTVDIATNNFTAAGGDAYPFGELADDFVPLEITYQQALLDFIVDDLDGEITAAEYPEGGEGRILVAPQVDRLAGGDRIATAVEISMADHPNGATRAYVARADLFADAVSAGPVAFADDAPILLTRTDELPTATADELERLEVDEIVVLGGEDAVQQSVVDELDDIATTTRIAGGTRYETATMVSADEFDDADVVYVATGENFPDALTGGVAAALDDAPVLLVQQSAVPEAVTAEIDRLSPSRIVLLGGTDAIAASVEDTLEDQVDTVDRIEGGTRYDTAALVADTFEAPVLTVYVATGEEFPDALAGVPSAAAAGGPILLTESDDLTDVTDETLAELDPAQVLVLGGSIAVADDVVDEIRSTLAPPAAE